MEFVVIFFLVNGVYYGNIDCSNDEVQFLQSANETKIRIPNWEITDEIGAPELPSKVIRIALPYGAKINRIEVLSTVYKEWQLKYDISFAQKPVILSKEIVENTSAQNSDIYLSKKPYPETILQFKGAYILDNYQICELICVPFQYYPSLKKLIFYSSIDFAVHYEGGLSTQAKNDIIKKLVLNDEDIISTPERLERNQLSYLIITESPMDTVFQRLADWKTKKGLPAGVRNVSWIISHYAGEDSAAKIRNYLKTLVDSNTKYVLLGGDVDYIPCRFAYAMTCSAGYVPGREDTLPCDLYYADLQGNWDLDNDGSYGEIEDSINLYPDLFVGRAPVNTIEEAQRFVNKILIYEKNPQLNYLDKALFAAEILWANPYTDQGVHKNKIGNESFPVNFTLTKLYQSLGNETKTAVMQAIRDGQNLINHDGHGWINLISVGGWPHRIYSADFDTITNIPRYGILYSIGCWTNAFDSASVSEAFVNSPNGGGVAFIGNSSYGWGSPGNPGFGYSDRFDSRFFHSLFNEDNFHLGEALAIAKAYFVPYSREKNVYRWHQYQINLLGDPEMPVWTQTPETLLVSHPQFIPLGNTRILITVKDKQTQAAIKNALVCLKKGNESYASGYTDASGSVFLNVTPATTGVIDLTVSAHNYLVKETTIPVLSGSYVNYLGWSINDTLGNNDGIANPNENILLPTMIKNCGSSTAYNIQIGLHSADSFITILDSTASLNLLNPGDSVIIDDAFNLQIGNATNGRTISFDLTITDSNQTIDFNPIMLIGTALLKVRETSISSPPTLPGQTESLYVDLKNEGFGFGHSTWAKITSSDPYVSVLVDSVWYGEIYPESAAVALQPFVVSISSGCPASYLALLSLTIHGELTFNDTIELLIGETGFADDMEAGTARWTTGGINNLWHISTRRSFSPTHSWYCGNEGSGQYVNNMNCYIQTIPFMVQANSLLRFYRWFNVPIYGTDGIYVIIQHHSGADTLDFIGTGGALKQRPIQSNWFEEKYSLGNYYAGDTIQVRIAFVSDNDGAIGEGFYIDDVNVEYVTALEEKSRTAAQNVYLTAYPNPFRHCLLIELKIDSHSQLAHYALKIYDATGRLVKSFYPESFTQHQKPSIIWFGDDDSGHKLPAGVYFIRFEAAAYQKVEKAVILR
ncbi:MAG: C25 family cysteine peptidase [bacterium]